MTPHSAWLSAVLVLASAPSSFAQEEAEALSSSFRKAARRVLPAVVTVRAVPQAPPAGPFPATEVLPAPLPLESGGSGVVIDAARGLVLTNDHVVAPAPRPRALVRLPEAIPLSRLLVTLPDGRERTVKEVRSDPRGDLALLRIDPRGLQQADWGDSGALDTGDWVLAVGQPFGLSDSVTAGIVSGKGRGLGLAFYEDLIQTDAAINPGNSGGPLVNLKGEVVGINTAIKSRNGGYEGVGFAVPSVRARRIASDLAEFGHVRRLSLGIRIGRLPADADEALRAAGAVPVSGVVEGRPAALGGIRPGDILVAMGAKPVGGTGALQSAIEFATPGEPLVFSIWRDGQSLKVTITPTVQPEGPEPALPAVVPVPAPAPALEPFAPEEPALLDERPAAPGNEPEARAPMRFPSIGLRLSEPTDALIRRHGLDPATRGLVVIGVEPDGAADRAGVEIGMVITDAADRKVTTLPEFRAALAKRPPDGDLVLRILKAGKPGFRVLLGRAEAKPRETDSGAAAPAPPDGRGVD